MKLAESILELAKAIRYLADTQVKPVIRNGPLRLGVANYHYDDPSTLELRRLQAEKQNPSSNGPAK